MQQEIWLINLRQGALLFQTTAAFQKTDSIRIRHMSESKPVEIDFPMAGRLGGIDYGTVRIGVATCDPDRILVSPVEVYQVRNEKRDAEYFRDFAKQDRLVGFVVGLPIHCDGAESKKSKECRSFARWLADQTELPVRLFDERFSTAAAKERLAGGGLSRQKKKKQLDAIAAMVLLESFLESCRYHDMVMGQSIHHEPTGGDTLE